MCEREGERKKRFGRIIGSISTLFGLKPAGEDVAVMKNDKL